MSDVIGADMDPDLSVAYQALERRREEVIIQRDRIAEELKKLDTVLEALRALAVDTQERAAANSQAAAFPAAETAEATGAKTKAAPGPAAQTAQSADRKVRIIEFLLENSRQWFTASEIVTVTEGASPSATQRNAVSEALRRLLRRGGVQRDEKSRPVRYKAVPAVLREFLLAAQ
jgi:DNA-binding transcriptional ArsR family regulator